jgi:hypothetical protein
MQRSHTVAVLVFIFALSICCARAAVWNQQKAKIFQSLAWSSYCPFSKVKSWSCFWCTKSGAPKLSNVQTAYSSSWDNFAYAGIALKSKTIYVVFRGTTLRSYKQILEDAVLLKKTFWKDKPDVELHTGFANGYKSLRSQLVGIIKNLKKVCRTCSLVMSGHSLGGAMATIATVDLSRAGLKVAQLVTLGSPRVGNDQFASYFQTFGVNHVRWVNKHDIVAQQPPPQLGFHHATQEYWSTDGSSFRVCSASNGENRDCSVGLHFWNGFKVSDHLKYLNVNLAAGKKYRCDGVYANKQ